MINLHRTKITSYKLLHANLYKETTTTQYFLPFFSLLSFMSGLRRRQQNQHTYIHTN